MDLREYQIKSRDTAVYPNVGDNFHYPLLGLINEFGEFCGKLKKVYRDKDGVFTDEDWEHLRLELSDVYWYLAQLATEWQIELHESFSVMIVLDIDNVVFSAASNIGKIAMSRPAVMFDGQFDPVSASYQLHSLAGNLKAIAFLLGSSASDIMDMNIAKLQSRKERGVLKGSGDDR